MPNEFKIRNGLVVDAGGAQITGSLAVSSSSSNFNGNVQITDSASNSLLVKGSGTTSATNAFRVEDSAGNRDEIEININNCTKYEKVWTLDETYYTERVIENGVNEYLDPADQQYELTRVYDRSFISAYGTFYFRDTFKPQLVHEYLKYNYCGYGAKPRIVNR